MIFLRALVQRACAAGLKHATDHILPFCENLYIKFITVRYFRHLLIAVYVFNGAIPRINCQNNFVDESSSKRLTFESS